jgi:mRNA-degrading endonuclease RelE of RelBE toxin-antitoxin system
MTEVSPGRYFLRQLKRLRKKYPTVQYDVQALMDELSAGMLPGDQVPGVGYTVYKVRLASSDMERGKSGGFRVIYYVRTAEHLYLVTIYVKSEASDIPAGRIRYLVEDILDE